MATHKSLKTMFFMLGIVFAAVFVAGQAYAAAIDPSGITLDANTSSIELSWPETGAEGAYSVWRSTQSGDTSLRGRIVGFSSSPSFIDSTAIVGAKYRYAVVALDEDPSTPSLDSYTGVVSLLIADPSNPPSPHRTAGSGPLDTTCARCHSIPEHEAGTPFLFDQSGAYVSQSVLCIGCHAAQGDSFDPQSTGSGHSLAMQDDSGWWEHSCATCHDAHGFTTDNNNLMPDRIGRVGSEVDKNDVNGLCSACHTDAYATESYVGPTVYSDGARNVHSSLVASGTVGEIGRPAGSCLHCHGGHRTVSPYAGLLVLGDPEAPLVPNSWAGDAFVRADNAPLCATCHDGIAPTSEETTEALESWGVHRILSAGGELDPGTSLPCWACHDPHGSERGNALNLSDRLGGGLDPRAGADEERRFCFTCHTDYEGYGWDSGAGASGEYVIVPEGEAIFGLSRSATESVDPTIVPSSLRLLGVPLSHREGQPHSMGSDLACSACHFSAHRPELDPNRFADMSCYDCHETLRVMDKASADKQSVFHHVLGSSVETFTGGSMLASYEPPSAGNGYSKACLSCHIDHITENQETRALRTSPAIDAAAASSDFIPSSDPIEGDHAPGLCISCHSRELTRSGTHQKDAKYRISGGASITSIRSIDAVDFEASRHNFAVPTHSGNAGNCVKCHNDGTVVGREVQDFSVHESPNQSLISRIGDETDPTTWNATPAQYKLCYKCHARYGEVSTSTIVGKLFANRDWFNVTDMQTRNENHYRGGGVLVGSRVIDDQAVLTDMFRIQPAASGSPIVPIDLTQPVPQQQWAVSGHLAEYVVTPDNTHLNEWYRTTTTAVRCTDCHDVHATTRGVMATGQEWPLTKKALPPVASGFGGFGANGGTLNSEYPYNLRSRIITYGTDDHGHRLITLNDLFYRESLYNQLKASGSFTQEQLDRGSITPQMIRDAGLGDQLATQWESSVGIFCFQCHSVSALTQRNHSAENQQGPGTEANHKNAFLPCVGCHVPAVHGSGLIRLLADRGIDDTANGHVMPEHQRMTWYNHYTNTSNTRVAGLWSIYGDLTILNDDKVNGCATGGNCHQGLVGRSWAPYRSNQTGPGWVNWKSTF